MNGLNFYQSDTKRELLVLMKQRGAISLDDAVAATGLTRTTLREHLGQLERDHLVAHSSRRRGRGRPSLLYRLTPEGERLFPSHDGLLLGRLLDFMKAEGADALIRAFFERFWDERYRDASIRLAAISPDDLDGRLHVLAEILEEQGFMPQVHANDGDLAIRECNCPFPEAVKRTRIPCRLEAQFFERVFSQRPGRVSYIPDGSPACTYEFPLQRETPGAGA